MDALMVTLKHFVISKYIYIYWDESISDSKMYDPILSNIG